MRSSFASSVVIAARKAFRIINPQHQSGEDIMIYTPNTASDVIVAAASGEPESPPKIPSVSPPAVGDPEVVVTPIRSGKPPVAPAPLKI